MDMRVPFVVFTVASAVHGSQGGMVATVKLVAWVGLLALMVADIRWRRRHLTR
jgi:hypothetical protein